MRKNFCLLILIMALVACSGNGASSTISSSSNSTNSNASTSENSSSDSSSSSSISSSSSSSSSSSDSGQQLTEEERRVKEITDYLGNNPLAFEGHYTMISSYIPDLSKPDEKVVQSTDDYGIYSAVVTDEYCFTRRDRNNSGRADAVRYDHDKDGYIVVKILNPLTNETEDSYVLDPSGRKMLFRNRVGNPFKEQDAYKFFTLDGNQLISKAIEDENNYFKYDRLVNAAVGAMYGEYRRIIITLDSNNKPTNMSIQFWEVGRIVTQEFTLDCEFISLESAGVPSLPTAHPHQDEHTALQNKFDTLSELMNYQIDYEVTTTSGDVTSFSLYLNKDFYYVDYPGDRSVNKGGYFTRTQGLTDIYYSDLGPAAKGLPKKAHNVEEMFVSFWKYKAETFYLDNDGNYVLYDDAGLYDNIRNCLVPDLACFNFSNVNESSFKLRFDGEDILYTYTVVNNSISARVKNIGSTEKPFSIDSLIPYDSVDSMEEYIERTHPARKEDTATRIGLMVNYDYSLLPYVDTPYEHSSKMDCIGTVGIGLVFTMAIIFTFRFDSAEEMWLVTNQYYDILDARTDYTYDYDNECYLYQHDNVNFKITFSVHENHNGYRFALEYRIDNLNEQPPLEW